MEKFFVAKDLAELLRQKGFEEHCIGFNNKGRKKIHFEYNCFNRMKDTQRLSRPTYDQVIDWISSRYNVEVIPQYTMERNWIAIIHYPNDIIEELPHPCTSRVACLAYAIGHFLKDSKYAVQRPQL